MHRVGTRAEWLTASRALLAREKEHSRAGDQIARLCRELPWVPVTKQYTFATDDGPLAGPVGVGFGGDGGPPLP